MTRPTLPWFCGRPFDYFWFCQWFSGGTPGRSILYWRTRRRILRVMGGSFPFWQYFAIQLIKCNHDSFFTTTKQERQWCSADPNESSLMCCDGLSPLCLCGGSPSRIEMRRVIDHSQSRFFVNEHRGGMPWSFMVWWRQFSWDCFTLVLAVSTVCCRNHVETSRARPLTLHYFVLIPKYQKAGRTGTT